MVAIVTGFLTSDIPTPMPDSPAMLESSLSPAELVPFQGCVIPPLSPQWDLSAEDSLVSSHAEAHDAALWEDVAQCQAVALGDSVEANNLVSPQPRAALWLEHKKGDLLMYLFVKNATEDVQASFGPCSSRARITSEAC